MAVVETIDNLRAWRFAKTVRKAQSMGPVSLNELRKAIPSNGGRCLLATAMDCVTDNHVMAFPDGGVAKRVAKATGMRRQGEVEVALPDYMTDVAWAFDRQLFDFPLLLADPAEFRRHELEQEFADWNFDGQQMREYVRTVRQILGMQCNPGVSLETDEASGPAVGSYVSGRELGCPVHEPQPEYCPGGYAMVLMPDEAMLLCDVLGADVDIADAFGLDGCVRPLDVPLPDFMNALAAAVELKTLDSGELAVKRPGQPSSHAIELGVAGGQETADREVLAAAA